MVAIWEALATRTTDFLRHTMNKQYSLPPGTAWVNYVRSHDDIGWGFADEDAAEMGLDAEDHRYFLNLFYLGRFPGSFANGLPFNFNPRTQDMRISGTTASLAGLERADKLDDVAYRETAIRRILMIHSIVLSAGGIPLIYLGDEVGTTNDYAYRTDSAKKDDSRWVHRPFAKPEKYARRTDASTVEGKLFQGLLHLISIRKQTPALADGDTWFISTGNSHVLGYKRHGSLLALANFTEFPQQVSLHALQNEWSQVWNSVDLITGEVVSGDTIQLAPYQFMWLVAR
jgi:amylosucrase